MAIDKRKKIRKFTIDGEDIALAGHQDIVIQNASGYSILTGDIPNTTIVCVDADGQLVGQYTTPAETGGAVNFAPTKTGVYSLVATRDGKIAWTKQVNVDNIGVFIAGAGNINDYTVEELGLACAYGYYNAMFRPKEEWIYSDETSAFHGLPFVLEQLQLNDGVTVVDFRLKAPYSKATYMWNNYFTYLTPTATSFAATYSSAGGHKYSTMIQLMMKKGDEVYMQATGIKPDGSTISGGIEFSKLFYTKGNGKKSALYTYNPAEDSMSEDSEYSFHATADIAKTDVKFMKGYFAVATDIDIENFSASYYYTRATVSKAYVYTHATEYVEGTTYYGFYETMQEDGFFLQQLAKIRDYLVPFESYASTGLTNTTHVSKFENLVNILCVENFTGVNRSMKTAANVQATTLGCYNIAGEGRKIDIYDYENTFVGVTEWTSSTYSYYTYTACCLSGNGSVSSSSVYYTGALRVGFRFTKKQT